MRPAGEMLSVVCASMLLIGLSACGAESAEPSAADIRAVLLRAELSNPDMMRFDQAMLDGAAHNAGVRSRPLTDILAVDKGQCVPATNASGFVCDIRTGVPNVCPVNRPGSTVADDSVDAAPNDAMPGSTPIAAPVKPTCSTAVVFGGWRKLRLFEADGQWQVTAAE